METGLTELTGLEIAALNPVNPVNPVYLPPRLCASAVK
jgi:hypothetical protein